MDVLAALGDASTAAIAIVAILLAVFFAVRGQRGERGAVAAGAADEAVPTLLKVPLAPSGPVPDADPDADGLRTMAVGEVGHGAIRLGRPPAPAEPELAPEPEPAPVPDPEPAPTPGTAPFRQGPINLRKPSGDS